MMYTNLVGRLFKGLLLCGTVLVSVMSRFSCQVVVLPSQYDIHHHHVYPQPAFSKVLVQKRLLEKVMLQ